MKPFAGLSGAIVCIDGVRYSPSAETMPQFILLLLLLIFALVAAVAPNVFVWFDVMLCDGGCCGGGIRLNVVPKSTCWFADDRIEFDADGSDAFVCGALLMTMVVCCGKILNRTGAISGAGVLNVEYARTGKYSTIFAMDSMGVGGYDDTPTFELCAIG